MSHTVVEGPDPLLGSKVAGRYTIMRRIAKGGMGVVYLAVQEPLGRAIALKLIRADQAKNEEMQRRFEREAKAASQLAHPNIVTVFDYGRTEDGALYLAMELVDGETLREVLKKKGRLPPDEALLVVEAILAALTRAHASGMVHRDLKPENIILPKHSGSTAGGVVAKVLDFGLAKPHDPNLAPMGAHDNITQAGGFIGTPGYAAPEQAQGEPESPRQDLYALAVIWWEMLTGAHPFSAPTPMKIVARQLVEDAPQVPAIEGLSAPFSSLMRRLLAKNPEQRPADALAVVEELKRCKAEQSALADSTVPTQTGPAVAAPAKPLELAATVAPPVRTPTSETPHAGNVLGPGATPSDFSRIARSDVTGPRRMVPVVLAACGAALVGAVVAVVVPRWTGNDDALADAGLLEVSDVDAPPPRLAGPPRVALVLKDVPHFSSVRSLSASIEGATLEYYRSDKSLVFVDAKDAGALAEQLQGKALDDPTRPLVLEVVEVRGMTVTMKAVSPDESSALADAGPGALDAGPVDVVKPGGLDP